MPSITLTLSDSRYAALRKTQELMLLAGGTAQTPEEYAQTVMDGACDSYAAQYPDAAPSAEEIAIYEDALVKAEALAAAEIEKRVAVEAKLAENAVAAESLADQLAKV